MTRLPRHYAAARRSYAGELGAAAGDFAESMRQWRLWTVLAVNDIAGRYRGSILGPFWITLAAAAFVCGIGLVYGGLMHVPTEKYVPYMASGVVLWTLISGMIVEGSDAYITGAAIIRQTSIPLPLFVWRVVLRNILNFAHQIIVILAVAIWFHFIFKINLPMVLFGLILLLANTSWIAFLSAIISARFRDFQQIVNTSLQLIFFVSPVIWIPSDMAKVQSSILMLNPVYHMLDVTREPLLGHAASLHSVIYLAAMAMVGWLVTFGTYASVRRRIVHYI